MVIRRALLEPLALSASGHEGVVQGRAAERGGATDWIFRTNRIDYGLESAKPDLQSTFKKPGGNTAAP